MSNSNDDSQNTPNLRIGIVGGAGRGGLPPLGVLLALIASGAGVETNRPRSVLGDLFGEGKGRGSAKTPPAEEREIPMEVAEMIMDALTKEDDHGCGECDGCKARASLKETILKEKHEQSQKIVTALPRSILKINTPLYMIDDFIGKDGLKGASQEQLKAVVEALDVITSHISALRAKVQDHGNK